MALPRVYVIGDSISIQYGPWLEAYLRGRWIYTRKSGEEEALRDLDHPQGANGGDSSMVLDFLQTLRGRGGLEADRILLNCGLHDIKTDPASGAKQVPLDAYGENLRAIVAEVRALGPRLAWVRTTPADETVHNTAKSDFHRFAADVDAYNAAADAVMAEAGVPSADLHAFTRNLDEPLYCDHVHFHEPVRIKQAAFLAGFLEGLRPL